MGRLISVFVLFVFTTAVAAETVQEYCNDLYPGDSYEAEDRQVYIAECIELYAPDFAGQASDVADEVEQVVDESTADVSELQDAVMGE